MECKVLERGSKPLERHRNPCSLVGALGVDHLVAGGRGWASAHRVESHYSAVIRHPNKQPGEPVLAGASGGARVGLRAHHNAAAAGADDLEAGDGGAAV